MQILAKTQVNLDKLNAITTFIEPLPGLVELDEPVPVSGAEGNVTALTSDVDKKLSDLGNITSFIQPKVGKQKIS